MAFHSIGRLLFHVWIPGGYKEHDEGRQSEDPTDTPVKGCRYEAPLQQQEEHEEGPLSDGELDLLPLPSRSPSGHGGGGGGDSEHDTPTLAVADTPTACAEHAVLRISLILHESPRCFDSRVRAAARGLARGLRLRKRRARRLLARSALLVLDHGLANGSLDGLKSRFPTPRRGNENSGRGVVGSPAMSVSPEDEHERRDSLRGDGPSSTRNFYARRERRAGLSPPGSRFRRSVENSCYLEGVDGRGSGYGGCSRQMEAGDGGGGHEDLRGESRGGVTERLGGDALQYAGAVRFLVGVSADCLKYHVVCEVYEEKHYGRCTVVNTPRWGWVRFILVTPRTSCSTVRFLRTTNDGGGGSWLRRIGKPQYCITTTTTTVG